MCSVVGSYPGGFLARFIPTVAAEFPVEEDSSILLGKLMPIHAGIGFGAAMTF